MEKGRLIIIEGIDGSGKATQAGLITKYLMQKRETVQISFPNYSSPFGKLIRLYLDKKLQLEQFELNNLYSADRYYALSILNDLLEKGIVVIADRYTPSNICYGSFNGDTIDRIELMDKYLPVPDIIILVDVDPNMIKDRISEKDRNEQNIEYLEKVRKNYLIQYYLNQGTWRIVDGHEREEEVHKRITNIVQEIL
jgi:dTMP kinase